MGPGRDDPRGERGTHLGRTLSVRQPWAWALIHGGKDVENRTWSTRYRGPLLIHAGKTPATDEDWVASDSTGGSGRTTFGGLIRLSGESLTSPISARNPKNACNELNLTFAVDDLFRDSGAGGRCSLRT